MAAATGKAGLLSRRVGPLPVYLWLLLAAAAWFVYSQQTAAQAAPPGSSAIHDLAGGQQLATAGDLPVGGAGASGSALQQALSATDPGAADGGFGGAPSESYAPSTDPTYGPVEPTGPVEPWVSSYQPGTIYFDDSGNAFSRQPSGMFIPAFIGPSGSYVSPGTPLGLGFTPDPIGPGLVKQLALPPLVSPPASNRPTAQNVFPAPVAAPPLYQPSAQTVLVGAAGNRKLAL